MKLTAYLSARGLTNAEFAKLAQLSEGTVSLLCRGQIWLSRDSAEKIVRATKGAVTPNDFLRSRYPARQVSQVKVS